MKTLSFELTMPNVGSWNGQWTGADRKYYIIKTVNDRYFKNDIQKLLEGNKKSQSWYYNFGDGWGANVELQIIDPAEGKKRRKMSRGFYGYDWMVDSILRCGEIKI